MAEGNIIPVMSSENDSSSYPPGADERIREGEKSRGSGLTDAQKEVLERCLYTLTHAKNDSHTLAALLLVRVNNLSVTSNIMDPFTVL